MDAPINNNNGTYINYDIFGEYQSLDVFELAHPGEDLLHWL